MNPEQIKQRMESALEAMRRDFTGLRTGRASTSMLETVKVEAYGGTVPLNQVAAVSVPEPRLLNVQVWDKTLVKAVEKGIRDAGLGLNPQNDGAIVRVPVPELSQERRLELVRIAGKYAEQARVAIRNVRREAMDELKKQHKDSTISEDEQKTQSEKVQKITDEYVGKVDEALAHREKEITQV